ncbi:HEAT repeat domain-containing protein [Streptomyces solicathayae]|uniref:HEAT repeat domain-containing protein n=1 Tax=Streptomyces solicathayae TaxID=3081768 RepID=A0ABZ0LK68_9ACTN|nr:HEAT repeat domain-containing protein [Streptomyces sp. HUAS YS2]WOX19909.1 HEAT repeat domain-containing protein [Streptomyces sp. HUAS YS2]
MINELENIDWASLWHAYGAAGDVPGWLRGMASPDPEVRKEAFGNFYGAVLHQGSVYSSTVATLPFLFAMADDPATPDRGEVVALLLSIGREAIDAEEICAVICGDDGEDSTIYPDTANLMREHASAFVAYACDPDPLVRGAAIEGLGLFLDDAERAVALLRDRLVDERGVLERVLVVRTMADLALRLPAAAIPVRTWLDALADSDTTDPNTRLAALVHRARCAPESIDDQTVPTAIELLRQVTPIPQPEQDHTRGDRELSRPCACEAEPEPDPNVPEHVAAAFAELERQGRIHAPTTHLLVAFHAALGARVEDRTALLTEQLCSADPGTRYDAIDMARSLITSLRGDHTGLVRLIGDCLLPHDAYTAAAAAEALGYLATLAKPAREALADYVTTHQPDAWASPHRVLRRAHQQAVVALAGLGDGRALPSLLTALDTDTDTWLAMNAVGHMPQSAAELTPRLVRRLADVDHSREWPDVSPTALASALAKLGDPAAVPALAETIQAAVRHNQWPTAVPVLNALASFGTRAASALDTVRPLTDADNDSVRTAAAGAVWELEHLPVNVVPLLENLLHDRRNFDAIDLAGRIGSPAAAILPRLRQILKDQLEQNARNEQNDSAVLNDSWTLVHVASALWDIGGTGEAAVVVPALLNAWRDNDSTACDVVACLNRMGPAARPALPHIKAAMAQSQRGGHPWGGDITRDLDFQHACRAILTRFQDLPDHNLAGEA